jgi:ribosome-binding factor A
MRPGIERLQEVIRKKVATVILRDLHDPRIRLVTVTKVRLARDLGQCRVYWSTIEEGGARTAIAHGLEDARPFIQREVAATLNTRKVPVIEFVFDPSIEGVERLSRILREARAEDERRAAERTHRPEAGGPLSPDGGRA